MARQIDGLSDQFTVVAWDAPGAGASSDPPETFRLPDWADCPAAFIAALELEQSHVAGRSWGRGPRDELYGRHQACPHDDPLSAYAGWAGSIPADVVAQRLQLIVRNSELPPDQWAPALIDTLVTKEATPEMVEELRAMISDFHPVATRTAIRALAEADLRDVLPRIRCWSAARKTFAPLARFGRRCM